MAAGDLYLCSFSSSLIYRRAGGYSGSSWDTGITIPTGSGRLEPRGITFDLVGNLYLCESGADKVFRRAGGYGGSSWDTGIAAPAGASSPRGLAFDPAGNLYLVDTTTDKVFRRAGGYSGSSWDTGITAPAGASSPTGIAFDPAGNLYLVDTNADKVFRRAGGYSGSSWDTGITLPSGASSPSDIAFDPAGNLYLVDTVRNRIYRRAGGYSGSSWDTGITAPSGITFSTGIAFELAVAPSFSPTSGSSLTGLSGSAITPRVIPQASGFPSPTYTASGLPSGLSFNPTTRTLSGTPTGAGRGVVTITARNSGGTATYTINFAFTNPNLAPTVLIATPSQALEGGESIRLDIQASDRDGTIVSYRWTLTGPGTLNSTTIPEPVWTAPAHIETTQTSRLTITVRDDDGATDTATITLRTLPRPQFALSNNLISGLSHEIALNGILLGGMALGNTLLYEYEP